MSVLHPPLTDTTYLKKLLDKTGLTPARSAGQNFLISPEVIEAITTITAPGPDHVTELGAGAGPATVALLTQGKTVRAIERDQILAAILKDHIPRAAKDRFTLAMVDLKTADWTWPEPYQIVGNIPYNLSGFILRRLSQLANPPTQVTLLVQQEVGERLSAAPPDFHLLSLATQLWATVTPLLIVPPDCFWPAPKVTSQLVLLTPRPDALPLTEREAIIALAKPLFQQRRKQLRGTLAHTYHISAEQAAALLTQCGIAPQARPQEVTLEQWEELHKAIIRN